MDVVTSAVAGAVIGLLPGFHINNAIASSAFSTSIGIISSSIAFVFSSFIPLLLLGIPSPDNAVILLPAHSLVIKGKAMTAALINFYSCFLSMLFSFPLLAFMVLFKPAFSLFINAVPFVLLFVLLKSFFSSRKAMIVTVLSGLLGLVTYKQELLLPLLSGFFAASSLIISKPVKAVQHYSLKLKSPPKLLVRSSFAGSFLGMFFSLVPAVSSSITAGIGRLFGRLSEEEFVAFSSSVNMTYMIFSFYALLLFGKTRSGSAVALSKMIGSANFVFISIVIFFSASFTLFIMLFSIKKIIAWYDRANKKILSYFSLAFISLIIFFLNGFYGLLVFFTATAIGLTTLFLRAPRITCMAALIIPTLILLFA